MSTAWSNWHRAYCLLLLEYLSVLRAARQNVLSMGQVFLKLQGKVVIRLLYNKQRPDVLGCLIKHRRKIPQ
ncbi:hypothetical protein [Paraburkholderia bannensis]|uniref:hypothetical protein n=1 Tax=Paraburkholderia bannensis TaxID=765414 RepID=UPI002ABD807C|nr:hypothetical protein [Paraburkholderia bannensis]